MANGLVQHITVKESTSICQRLKCVYCLAQIFFTNSSSFEVIFRRKTVKFSCRLTNAYSRTSMARTLMARLPWLF